MSEDVLVPVSDTDTLERTVRYAVEEYGTAHFVVPVGYSPETEGREEAENILDKVRLWVEDDGYEDRAVYEVLAAGRYLFSPDDYADVFSGYCDSNGIGSAVLDPGYSPDISSPLLQTFEAALHGRGIEVEVAPVERPTRRTPLPTGGDAASFVYVAMLSFGFYLAVGTVGIFDGVTGAATAVLVAAVLYRVSFETPPSVRRSPVVAARMLIYTPYLLWEMVKANFQIAYVVLHPRLPIDPTVEEFDAAVWGGLPVTTLGNSITLTPGTLTVDVDGRTLHVHSLTEATREGLLDGDLERAVRFVFYGREAADIPTPRERRERDARRETDEDGEGTDRDGVGGE